MTTPGSCERRADERKEAMRESLARGATRCVMQTLSALYRDDECGATADRIYARIRAALEWYEFYTARRA